MNMPFLGSDDRFKVPSFSVPEKISRASMNHNYKQETNNAFVHILKIGDF